MGLETLNIFLAITLAIFSCILFYYIMENYRRLRINKYLTGELMKSTQEAAEMMLEHKKKQKADDAFEDDDLLDNPLNSKEMLSSLLTVIIHKYGSARLGPNDFTDTPEEAYVSVYVDKVTGEIMLSIDSSLGSDGAFYVPNFGMDDGEDTFH